MMRNIIASAAFTCVTAFASAASAQTAPAPTPGPLVVETIHNGWLFAPDVRATDLGRDTGALAGGYIGRITDNSLIVGGGGYLLTNREDGFNLWYVGPVVEWIARADRRIGFGVRGLVGGGSATLPLRVTDLFDPRVLASSHTSRRGRSGGTPIDPAATIAVSDDFFVAEPQLNLLVNVSGRQRLVFGVGYRVVGSAPYLGDSLNGVSGSISYQIGGRQ